jgi:hypothetical protein
MPGFEAIVVLAIGTYVAFQLPVWAEKLLPESAGEIKLEGFWGVLGQLVLAYGAAAWGWARLVSAIDVALVNLRLIAATPQIIEVVEVSDFILAGLAFFSVFWLLTTIFKNLPRPKNLGGTLGVVIMLGFALFWPDILWGFLRTYIQNNMQGAELLLQTEAWTIIKNGLN